MYLLPRHHWPTKHAILRVHFIGQWIKFIEVNEPQRGH
jgi:hypothetical protein